MDLYKYHLEKATNVARHHYDAEEQVHENPWDAPAQDEVTRAREALKETPQHQTRFKLIHGRSFDRGTYSYYNGESYGKENGKLHGNWGYIGDHRVHSKP